MFLITPQLELIVWNHSARRHILRNQPWPSALPVPRLQVIFLPPSRRSRCLSPSPLFWAASSWSSCPSGRRRSNAWSAAASFSPASPPTSWATSGRNPMWSRRCWVSSAFQLLHADLLRSAGWTEERPLHLAVKVMLEYWPKGVFTAEGGSGRVFSWTQQTPPGGRTTSMANALSLSLLRNLHHVLSEDLHVRSRGEGAEGGGWVKPSWAEQQGGRGSTFSSTLCL